MKKQGKVLLVTAMAGIIALVAPACAQKKVETRVEVPKDFVALLDYRQLPDGKSYGAVFVVSTGYQGSLELSAQGKAEKISIKPGQVREFAAALKLTVNDMISVKSADRTQQIRIKYPVPQQFALGFVDSPASMFTDKTVFYASKQKGNYIATYHIAKKSSSSLEMPNADTLVFALAYGNRITLSDAEGLYKAVSKPLEDRKIYYVTSYFYDMDYNYLGGSSGWEAKYIKEQQ
ncbi:MAG TPA: hypothetical protein P5511_08365 [Candidatus Goldiibacteriota bacterium]|nr:hypothetical protein [Candidatus Goldiibacteriota bacterium]